MKEKIAVFPGSFDPITKGHVNIVKRALPLFDKIIIALGNNTSKKYAFSYELREGWIKDIFKQYSNVEVTAYQGLTVNFARKVNAKYLVRGRFYPEEIEMLDADRSLAVLPARSME